MKEFKVALSVCFSCPNYEKLRSEHTLVEWCRQAGKVLDLKAPDYPIPSLCPLPDKVIL